MFEVKIETKDLDDEEERYIRKAGERMQYVFNHEKFKEFVLNYSYNYVKTTGALWWKKTYTEKRYVFANNGGLSNYQIYNKLLSGSETLDPELDGIADVFITVDRRNKKGVIGYTYPNTKWQYIYHWVLNSWGVNEIAGNIAHEWCHKIGFDHDFKRTAIRPYSVPYAIGYFVSEFKS